MIELKYMIQAQILDDDEERNEKEDKPEQSVLILMKKMEQLFLKKRAVYLWGIVEDKSARDVVS